MASLQVAEQTPRDSVAIATSKHHCVESNLEQTQNSYLSPPPSTPSPSHPLTHTPSHTHSLSHPLTLTLTPSSHTPSLTHPLTCARCSTEPCFLNIFPVFSSRGALKVSTGPPAPHCPCNEREGGADDVTKPRPLQGGENH